MATKTILKMVAAVILPPLGVGLHRGLSGHFFLSIVLTLLGFIPGIIHAVIVVGFMDEKN